MTTIQGNNRSQSVLDAMNPKKDAEKSVAAEAQDRFMKLLVTQMQNQDPLNPLDNAQVTSQLAQLSTVTGIDKLNTTLEALMGSYQTSQAMQAANLIGHGVLVPGSAIDVNENGGLMGVELTAPVDALQVTVRDASGREVRKLDFGRHETGTAPLAWDGKDAEGIAVAEGRYTFEIEATRDGVKVPATALQFGLVAAVETGVQGVKLNLPGMGQVNFTDVKQII